jgi:hypothetical protein
MTPDELATIRTVLQKRHGGLKEATDAEIALLWASIDAATRENLLPAVETRKPAATKKVADPE